MALQSTPIPFPPSCPGMIGATVKTLREARGLSLRELARRVGISSGALLQIERGASIPRADTLGKIADALHCFTDYLLWRSRVDTAALEALARDLAAFPCCWPGGCGGEARCLPCRARKALG